VVLWRLPSRPCSNSEWTILAASGAVAHDLLTSFKMDLTDHEKGPAGKSPR
jgi:hypothetical protein